MAKPPQPGKQQKSLLKLIDKYYAEVIRVSVETVAIVNALPAYAAETP